MIKVLDIHDFVLGLDICQGLNNELASPLCYYHLGGDPKDPANWEIRVIKSLLAFYTIDDLQKLMQEKHLFYAPFKDTLAARK